MRTRSWMAVAIIAAVAISGSFFLRQNRALRHLEAETAELQALNAAKDGELESLKGDLAGLRSSQAATEALLSSTIARLNALALQTNARSGRSTGVLPAAVLSPAPDDNMSVPKRNWGPEQAEGPPDTAGPGDIPTAWASREPDAGPEWLRLEYENWVEPVEIHVRETFNPGAISRVTATATDGQEVVVWEGVEAVTQGLNEALFQVQQSLVTRLITVYLDTARVPGWNEIDAVELIGRDGSRQWAKKASASSTYAERQNTGGVLNTARSLSWGILPDGIFQQ